MATQTTGESRQTKTTQSLSAILDEFKRAEKHGAGLSMDHENVSGFVKIFGDALAIIEATQPAHDDSVHEQSEHEDSELEGDLANFACLLDLFGDHPDVAGNDRLYGVFDLIKSQFVGLWNRVEALTYQA